MSVAMITRKGRNMDYITGVKNIKEKINSVNEVPKELIWKKLILIHIKCRYEF